MPSSKVATRKYQRQLDLGFTDLRFDQPLENEFQADYSTQKYRLTYSGLLLAAVLYCIFLGAKLFIDEGEFLFWTSLLRSGMIAFILCTVLLLRHIPDQRRYPFLFANYLFFAAAMAGIEVVTLRFGEVHHYEGIFFACFHCFLFGGMLLRQSLLCAACMIFIYTVISLAFGFASSVLAYQVFFLILASVMGGATLYQIELSAREAYLRRQLLNQLANRDSLTDIATRGAFSTALTSRLRAAAAAGQEQFTVALIDLDYFKQLNDSRGHRTGDKALKLVTRIVLEKLGRHDDTVGRWGGDELAVCLDDMDFHTSSELLELVRREIESLGFDNEESPHQTLTVSIGAVIVDPRHRESVDSLLHKADEMLYSAKSAGRNCVRIKHEQRVS